MEKNRIQRVTDTCDKLILYKDANTNLEKDNLFNKQCWNYGTFI